MHDFLGKELSIGDNVVFITPEYRRFASGKIVAFTFRKVRVVQSTRWNYLDGYDKGILQRPNQLVKV